VVVVISGPIASGKSTVARELARELELGQTRVAVIDLDVVHDVVSLNGPTSDEATWTIARHTAALQANAYLAHGVAVVIAEGSFNTPDDRAAFAEELMAGVEPRYVSLRVSFEEALRRAQGDSSRGLSRDPGFLGPYFVAVCQRIATLPASDIVIDTEDMSARSVAVEIMNRLWPTGPPASDRNAD
jgi:shikimate kinase